MLKKLFVFLEIRPGEVQAVIILFCLALCTGLAQVLARVAANTLFLENLNAHMLPWVYLGLAISAPLASYIYLRVGAQIDPERLLWIGLTVLLAIHLLLWGLVSQLAKSGATLVLVFIWVYVLDTLCSLVFWTLAQRVLDPLRAKHLAGLAGAGDLLARLVGGLAAPLWVSGFGLTSLLPLAGAALLAALGVVIYTGRQRELLRTLHSPVNPQEVFPSLRQFDIRSTAAGYNIVGYNWGIAAVSVTAMGLFFLADQLYQLHIDSIQISTVYLVTIIGAMEAVVGLAVWIARPLLSEPLLSRRGLLINMLALPLGAMLGAVLVAAASVYSLPVNLALGFALSLRLLVAALIKSTHQASEQVLVQAIPEQRRGAMRTTIEAFLEPGAAGIVGLLLLFLLPRVPAVPLYLLAPLVLIFTLLAYVVSRIQPEIFRQTLERRNLNGLALSVNDASSLAIIARGLENPQPGPVIYLLNLLEDGQHPSLAEFLRRLLRHPSPEVRQDALHRIERLAFTDTLDAVRECLASEKIPAVKGQCVRTLAALGESEIIEEVLPYLNSDDPVIRQNAMIGLLYSGGLEGVLESGHFLLEMSYSVDPEQRIAAANVLGEVSISNFYRPLLRLLRDKNPQVRRAALKSAGKLKNPRLWPLIAQSLAELGFAASARSALAAAGEPAIAFIESTFDNPETTNRMRTQLAQVAGRIGGARAVMFLQKHLEFPDLEVRMAILQALRQCHFQATGGETRKVEEAFYAEVRGAAWTTATLADLPANPALTLLHAALKQKYLRHRNQAALLVQLLYDPETLRSAWRTLNMPQRDLDEQRNAFNILNALLPQDKKDMLLALLEDPDAGHTAEKGAGRLNTFYPQTAVRSEQRLGGLLSSSDPQITPWIRACTLWALALLDPAAYTTWMNEYHQWGAGDGAMATIAARTLYFLLPSSRS